MELRVLLLVFFAAAASVRCHPTDNGGRDHQGGEQQYLSCGTKSASPVSRRAQRRALRAYRERRHLLQDDFVTIPVCFFVLKDDKGTNDRTDAQLQLQLDALNKAYSSNSCCDETYDWCAPGTCSTETNFRFAWALLDDNEQEVIGVTANLSDAGACVFRVNNPRWTRITKNHFNERKMKRTLRKGGANVLNVYWTNFWNPGLSGYATLPYQYQYKPQEDGVVARVDLIAGGETENFNEGDLLVHESAHWMGLLHTFEGGCGSSDGIEDTAPEAIPFLGCGEFSNFPIGRDTCPDQDDSPDPIFNFMDYSDDRCKFRFTEGQAELMQAVYSTYRSGQGVGTQRQVISLVNSIPSDPISLFPGERQIFSLHANSTVRCSAIAEEGGYQLYLKWGKEPTFRAVMDSCAAMSSSFSQKASCRSRFPFNKTVLYAGIRASSQKSVSNLVITCKEL